MLICGLVKFSLLLKKEFITNVSHYEIGLVKMDIVNNAAMEKFQWINFLIYDKSFNPKVVLYVGLYELGDLGKLKYIMRLTIRYIERQVRMKMDTLICAINDGR